MKFFTQKKFVIQEHHASRSHLHWDFRLEIEGVLKSWAVPKGIPTVLNVKKLAIQVEDHPLDYLNFEGEIAEGEYGAGQISIWDTGLYELLKFEKKRIEFVLYGKKVSGKYILMYWRNKDWLLMKLQNKSQ